MTTTVCVQKKEKKNRKETTHIFLTYIRNLYVKASYYVIEVDLRHLSCSHSKSLPRAMNV